jgi:large conductance mechanosensitive channel
VNNVLQEFKKFALKGNVLDLAVAVIIGAAFGKIVTSLVEDIIMPIIGLIMGGVNFSDLSFNVGKAVVKYGAFIQSIIDFLIIAISIFMVVRFFNRFKKKEEVAAPQVDNKEVLLTEIRDLLKDGKQ